MIARWLATPAALALTACSGTAGSDRPTSTISGRVLAGPQCPVVQAGDEAECADRPYPTRVDVIDRQTGRTLAMVQSDEDGRFRFAVPAGAYEVTAGSGSGLPYCQPEPVIVAMGALAAVTIRCDTGIR